MKKTLIITLVLIISITACKTKQYNTYNSYNTPPAQTTPASNDNQPYQPSASDYSAAPPQTGQQQYNPNNNAQQQYNNNTQVYSSDQYYDKESDQYYTSHQQNVNYDNSYQTFYDELSPYGSWVNYGGYGYVWIPAQGDGFRPYATNGHWVYTQYGWTWVSGYNWGWAPFHYGRWIDEPGYGWMWIPGNVWAPAQVTWGSCNGYYGWAPLGPNVNYYEGYRPQAQYWNFVPQGQITQTNINNYVVNHNNNTTIINNNTTNITVINNQNTYNSSAYNAGPPVNNVERVTGHKIAAVNIAEVKRPVLAGAGISANTLSVYRPAIAPATAIKSAPTAVVPITSAKTINATAVRGVIRQNTLQQVPPAGHTNPNNPSNPYQSIPRNANPNIQQQPETPARQQEPPVRREEPPVRQQEPPVRMQEPPARQEMQRPNEQRAPQERQIQERPVQPRPQEQTPIQRQPERQPIESRPAPQPPMQQPRQMERQEPRPAPQQHPATPTPQRQQPIRRAEPQKAQPNKMEKH